MAYRKRKLLLLDLFLLFWFVSCPLVISNRTSVTVACHKRRLFQLGYVWLFYFLLFLALWSFRIGRQPPWLVVRRDFVYWVCFFSFVLLVLSNRTSVTMACHKRRLFLLGLFLFLCLISCLLVRLNTTSATVVCHKRRLLLLGLFLFLYLMSCLLVYWNRTSVTMACRKRRLLLLGLFLFLCLISCLPVISNRSSDTMAWRKRRLLLLGLFLLFLALW